MFVNGTNKQMSGCTEVATAVDLAVAESSGERVTPRDPTANLLLPSSDIQMPSPVQVKDSTQGRAVTSLSSEYEHLLSMEPLNYEKTQQPWRSLFIGLMMALHKAIDSNYIFRDNIFPSTLINIHNLFILSLETHYFKLMQCCCMTGKNKCFHNLIKHEVYVLYVQVYVFFYFESLNLFIAC